MDEEPVEEKRSEKKRLPFGEESHTPSREAAHESESEAERQTVEQRSVVECEGILAVMRLCCVDV